MSLEAGLRKLREQDYGGWWLCSQHGVVSDDDAYEGQNPTLATATDPDGWTGRFYCARCPVPSIELVSLEETVRALVDVAEVAIPWSIYKHAPSDPRDDDLHDALARLGRLLGEEN